MNRDVAVGAIAVTLGFLAGLWMIKRAIDIITGARP